MTNWLQRYARLLGLLGVFVAVLIVGALALRQSPSQADTGMPAPQRASGW